MSEAAPTGIPLSDRRETFRRLRERLEPSRDPTLALTQGYYVEPLNPTSKRIAVELELDASCTQVLIGGVGSGKTTELLMAAHHLRATKDVFPVFFDVSVRHNIAKMAPGVLIVQAGLELAQLAKTLDISDPEVVRVSRELRQIAGGYHDPDPDPGDYDEDYGVYVPGVLTPEDPLDGRVVAHLERLRVLMAAVEPATINIALLVDGLDRMVDLPAFENVVRNDVQGLKALGLGVVLTGPLRAQYGVDRTILDVFDRFHYQPWIDVLQDGGAAMGALLRRRAADHELDEQALESLVRFSGGVARDLLALTQAACVEAYLDGSDTISEGHANQAADTFGRKQMQGLRPGELEVLDRVRRTGQFVETSEDDLALLMTRRVLEYRDAHQQPRYVVHPTMERFVAATKRSSV
jgi:hypothetical protein